MYSEDRYIYNTITVNVVSEVAVESIELGDDIRIEKGESSQLIPKFYPVSTTKRGVVYSSSDETVAKVSPSGLVTAVGNGTAIITAASTESEEIFDSVKVEVYVPVAGISIEDTIFAFSAQTEHWAAEFNIEVLPDDASNKALVWESSNPEIVYVDGKTGEVVLEESGVAKLRATTEDGSHSVEFIVGVSDDASSSIIKDIKSNDGKNKFYSSKNKNV